MNHRQGFAHLFDHYGMAGVLALICFYYSFATYTEQQPRGAAAAKVLAKQMVKTGSKSFPVLIVARTIEEDTAFVSGCAAELEAAGFTVAGKIQGDPRVARETLQKLSAQSTSLGFIATTADCAAWTLFENVAEKFPALGHPRVVFAASYKWPSFLKGENLLNIANQITVVSILAVGMTVVIITGGIDLSVGSLIALAAVVTTLLIRDHAGGTQAAPGALVLCSLAGVLLCALVGLFSGVMVASFRIPPFIATLAVMQVANGLAYILAKGQSIYEVPDSFAWLGRGQGWFSIPHAVLLMAMIYLAAHILMSRTTLGRRLYAVGGNAEAARLSGVSVGAVLLFAYTFCGALAGLGGVLLASQLKSGSPAYGASYELYVIAAVVVGGASLSGGEGKIFGTLIGALIIAVIQNGMNLTGVESYTQKVVLGAVILGAVLLDMLKRRGWPRWLTPKRKAIDAEPK